MKRPLSLLAAALVIVLVAAGCGSNGVASTLNDAATVRYTVKGKQQTLHVTRDQLLSEVGSIVANKPFNTYLKSQKFDVSADLTTDSKITAIWLSQLIEQQAIDSLFASRHLKVTPTVQAQAAKDVVQVFPDPTIFPAFSSQMRTTLADRQARTEALLASYTDTSDAAGEAYYKAHASQFACASGKDVAHILLKTKAQAQAVLDQLKGGASFATLAEKDSTDTTSGAQGGALGCLSSGEFVAPFQTAADSAPVGTPIGPVHSQFGYHVILVTKAAASYDSVRSQVKQALQQQGSTAAQVAITALLKSFNVHVDPRFGTWGSSTSSSGQTTWQVTAPTAPTPANSRTASTTTTTVPAASNGAP